MAIPYAALAFGSLLGGGGGTEVNTNVNNNAANQVSFTPNSIFNIGGGVSSNPYGGGITGNPYAQSSQSVTPNGQGGFSFPPYGGGSGGQYAAPVVSSGGLLDLITNNLPLIAIGGAALWFFTK